MINAKGNAVLRLAGFTQREINDRKQKFCNLFQIEPWLLPLLKRGEWVGLTDEEYQIIHSKNYNYEELALAVEAKLKEKNHAG